MDRVILEQWVQPLVQGAAQTLRLDSLPQADPTVRLQVCLETLGVEEETLEGVPAHLRLPVAVTRYWLRRASPEPTLLKALLMVMVQGELNRRTGGTTDGVVAHRFNQWQACLKDASQLHLLLCKPLPEPHFTRGAHPAVRLQVCLETLGVEEETLEGVHWRQSTSD
ncbi:unnamed protein product [Gadus morhua 'NCC']